MSQAIEPHTTNPNNDLLVTFAREGQAEEQRICSDGDCALNAALRILASLDALRAGDRIMCEWHHRLTLIERGLA